MTSEVRTVSNFKPSVHQQRGFDALVQETYNIVMNAVAGSGKTTWIMQALGILPRHMSILILAFNSHIKKELEARAPKSVKVQTCHSYGMGAIMKGMDPKPRMEPNRLNMLIDEIIPDERTRIQRRGVLKRLVGLAKAHVVWKVEEIQELAEVHDITVKDNDTAQVRAEIYAQVARLLDLCVERKDMFDFDDMIWWPVVLGLDCPRYDIIFVDEAQDLNKSNTMLIAQAAAAGGRVIFVGDPHQAIYSFRGADADAIKNIITKFKATELPLSICYRCSKAVVNEAKKIVPHIEASETAEDGEVAWIEQEPFLEKVQPGDMVLCRTSAPLVPVYFKLVRNKVKASIIGKDIGAGLAKLVERFKAESIKGLLGALDAYRAREVQKYMASYQPEKAGHVIDQVETIIELSSEADTPRDLVGILLTIFSDEREGIALSTVHKAKGLEADHVWVLRPELMPHPLAKQPWAQEQEMNLKYVAITRAKKTLHWVIPPPDARGPKAPPPPRE